MARSGGVPLYRRAKKVPKTDQTGRNRRRENVKTEKIASCEFSVLRSGGREAAPCNPRADELGVEENQFVAARDRNRIDRRHALGFKSLRE